MFIFNTKLIPNQKLLKIIEDDIRKQFCLILKIYIFYSSNSNNVINRIKSQNLLWRNTKEI